MITRVLATACLLMLTAPLLAEWHSGEANIMGTRISVTLWHAQPEKAEQLISNVMAEMRRIDHTYSPYKEASDLSVLNRKAAAGETVTVSEEMAALLDKSLYYGHLSEGAFDITYASLARFYDYREGTTPTEAQQQELLPAIDYRHVQLQDTQVRYQHPAVYIDLGGIAKGYAVDRAIDVLQKAGVQHASVSAGGDSRLLGDRRGRPWVVGIKQPRGGEGVAISLPLENIALSTSGDYERYFINEAGDWVHHIINPRTGKSAGDIASVSVLGPNTFDTDALSTTVFVLGVEKGLGLINQLPGFDAIIITRAGKVHYSEGLAPPE
ncbi:MAG TPA: FAD:protein FMN transferase [Cellvibrionaceae bacterium]